jgi:uncharacterized protein (TIGR02001 family)
MIRIASTSLAALLAVASLQASAQTAPASAWTVTGNAGLFTDYRFRGISQTNRKPAFQGGFDVAHSSGLYLGNWNSNVDSAFYNGANVEMDFYGGYKGTAGDFGFDIGAIYYYYPGSGAGGTVKIDNTEIYVGGSWGPLSLKYSYAASDFFGISDTKGAYYVDATVVYPFSKELSLIGHVGYQGGLKNGARLTEINGSGPYTSITDWKIGATYDWSGWILGASYVDSNRAITGGTAALDSREISGGTLVLSVTRSF